MNIYKYYFLLLLILVLLICIILIIFRNNKWYKKNIEMMITIPKVSSKLLNTHPITTMNKNDISNFSNLVNSNSMRKLSYDIIFKWVNDDINKPQYTYAKPVAIFTGKATAFDLVSRPDANIIANTENEKLISEYSSQGYVSGEDFGNEFKRCYKYVLVYLITNDTKYADYIIYIFNTWANTCNTIVGDSRLGCSWALTNICKVQEILMHKYSKGWSSRINKKWNNFIDKIMLPEVLKLFASNSRPKGCGNGWASGILALLVYSKLRNNESLFNKSINNAYLMVDWHFGKYTTGQTCETSRDIGHTQMGLGVISQMCEILYHHRIDLYSYKNNIFMKSYEFHAQIILEKIKKIQDPKPGTSPGGINMNAFGPANWDMVYNHYVNRKNQKMPFSEILLSTNRPDYDIYCENGLSTLTHYNGDGIINMTLGIPKPLSSTLPNIRGLRLWIDATDSNCYTLSGNNITKLIDKSGQGNNTNDNKYYGKQPTFEQNLINGKPGFNMMDGGFIGDIKNPILGTTLTFFMIINVTVYNTYGTVFALGNMNKDSNGKISHDAKTIEKFSIGTGNNKISLARNSSFATVQNILNTTYLISGYFNGENMYIKPNGGRYNSTNAARASNAKDSIGNFNINNYAIGVNSMTGAGPGNTKFGEILIYDKLLSMDDRTAIESYLAWKWEVPTIKVNLSKTTPTKTTPTKTTSYIPTTAHTTINCNALC